MKKYVQCPRCELNYITTPGDKYCKVCMREMKGEGGRSLGSLYVMMNRVSAI